MVDFDNNVDTIETFGPSFQAKVITSLIKDPGFLGQSFDVLNPNFFESDSFRWVCNKIIDYYVEYRKNPTLEYFKAELNDITKNETLVKEVTTALKEAAKHSKDSDLDYVQDKFLEFAKNQSLKNAILRSADMLERGQYGQIKVLIDQAMKAGTQKDVGLIWEEDFDERHLMDPRATISTGWDVIDKQLDGGLGPGELGIIMAPSGAGKSWVLTHFGKTALKLGLNVLHYSLELNQNYQGIRYDASFSGIEPSQIGDNLDTVRRVVGGVKGRLIIKYFPSRTVNVHSFYAHIDYLKLQRDFVPDLIIVDYADIMLSGTKSNARHEELGYIYEELRSMSGELQIPIWTASQTQRSSINEDIIEADKVGESYNKVKTADVLLSLSRKSEDKVSNTARFHIAKNRFGSDGLTFPSEFDGSTGHIVIADPQSDYAHEIRKKMENGSDDLNKELLSKLRTITSGPAL